MTDSTDNARGPDLDRLISWGFAPGSYMGFCSECGRQHTADKRAWRCLDCAERRADLAPDPLRAARVKPLVWEYHPAGAIAAPPTEFAYIIDTRMKGRVYSLKGFNPQREFSSMDEAKAAAQADYEQRIRSALEPDPQDARVAALVEAATLALEQIKGYGGDGLASGLDAALAAFDKGGKTDG